MQKKKLFWRTRGIIALNDYGRKPLNEVINCVVKFEDPHTKQQLVGYIMIEDLRKLILDGFVIHPTKGRETLIRIKEPVSEDEANLEHKPIIPKKTDLIGKLTGGL